MSALQLPSRHRPLLIRMLNAVGGSLVRMGYSRPRLEVEALLAGARRQTRLEDFGSETFLPGLHRLVASLNEDAALTQLGRIFAQRQVGELLGHRLRIVDHRKRHPEVGDERIERPLFVLGLPRTGTTLLYSLLALDPAHRLPLSWEVDAPDPPPEAESYENDPRIEITERRFERVRQLAPDFQAIHPIGALLPQECIVITACEFMSLRFEMCFDVRGYQEWLPLQDMGPAYRFHRHFLQHLQSRCPGDRWVLKSPAHLGPIGALLAEYPDAMVVQTHRDPLKVIPSVSSLEYTMRGIASDAVDPYAVGRQQLRQWSQQLEQGIAVRDAAPEREQHFFDVHFHEVLADPLGSVERIYAYFGLPLSRETEARMAAYLAHHPRDEHGEHRYSLELFGLDPARVTEAFKAYCERFGVETEEGEA